MRLDRLFKMSVVFLAAVVAAMILASILAVVLATWTWGGGDPAQIKGKPVPARRPHR